jgi:hypothetical protein
LQASSRLSGKLSAAKDAPQRQQTKEWAMSNPLNVFAASSHLHVGQYLCTVILSGPQGQGG